MSQAHVCDRCHELIQGAMVPTYRVDCGDFNPSPSAIERKAKTRGWDLCNGCSVAFDEWVTQ